MKKSIAILLTILLIFITATTVLAAEKVELTTNKSELNVGEEFQISINFDSEETSLYSYTAKLNYDKDIFEEIEKEDFEEQENWSDITYSKYDNKFSLSSKDEENNQKVLNINLKVKENAKSGETTITLHSASASNGENTIELEDASQKINIIGSQTTETKSQFPWLVLIFLILCVAIVFCVVKILPKLNLTKKEKNVITAIAIILVIALLIVCFKKIFLKSEDVNTEPTIKSMEYILEIKNPSKEPVNADENNTDNNADNSEATSETENSSYLANTEKVNLSNNNNNSSNNNNSNTNNNNNSNNNSNSNNSNNNNDNNNNGDTSNPNNELKNKPSIENINVESDNKNLKVTAEVKDNDSSIKDVTVYLIDENGNIVSEQKLDKNGNKFDISKAGKYKVKVKVTYDLGNNTELSLEKESEDTYTTPLNIKITNGKVVVNDKESYYLEKEQNAQLIYTFEANTDEIITDIYVNSEKLPATKNADGTYTVQYKAPLDAGKTDLKVTKASVNKFGDVDVTYNKEVEVLKSIKPGITNIEVEETEEKPVLTYKINDEEDTFVSGKIIITNQKTNETQEIQITDPKQTKCTLENIKDFTRYSINFEITYDLDENKQNADNQEVTTIAGIEFEPEADYKFTLEDLTVTNIDRTAKQITLQFTSTNITENNDEYGNYYVSKVTINGKSYDVKKSGTTYTVTIPYEEETKTTLELQSAELNNSHQFKDLQKNIVVFKNLPTASVETQVDSEQKTIKAKIDITDDDSTITGSVEVRLVDQNGKIILTKTVDKDTKEVTFEAENDMFNAGKYTVQVGVDYEAFDGISHNTKETIGTSEEIKVYTKASIVKAEVQNYYVEKGKNVDIKYTFKVKNNETKPTGININETFYQAVENADGTYTVSIPAETSGYGAKKHTVEIAVFGEETVVLESTEDANYYLLKDKPSIEYTFNEFVKNQTLEFDLKNDEKALIKDARVILTNEANEEVLNMPLKDIGKTTIELSKVPNGIYTLKLSGTYDLDDDENNNQNRYNLSEIFEERQIQVTSTYTADLAITNVEVKEQSAIITFTSTNSSNADVEYVVVDGEKYKVTKQEGTNTYTVEIPHENEENVIKKITAVIIRNDIDIDLNEVQTYEVFKTKPTVKDVTSKQEGNNLNVTFTLEDSASIAENVKAVIKKGNEIIQSKDITKGTTNVVFEDITQAGEYTIEFLADYDRADGKPHTQEKINEEFKFEVPITATVKLLKDTLNEYYDKGSEIELTYNITLNTEEQITSITVDGKEYSNEEFKISNGNYVIKVTAPNEAGEKIYKLTQIKCGEKPVKEVENEEAKIFVLKAQPKVTNFSLNKKDKTITFKLENPENAIIKGKVVLRSLDGKEVYEYPEDLKNDLNTIDLTKFTGMVDTTTYEVLLEGTYDLDNDDKNSKNEYSLEELIKEEIQLRIVTDITFDSFSTRYPAKGKDIEITFNVTSNTKIPVSSIYVNYKEYPATLVSDGKYKITYTAKSISGIENLTVSKVKHGVEEVDLPTPKTEQIDVLKSKPKVPFNYEIDDNYNERTITFKFTLEDPEKVIPENGAYVIFGNGKFHDAKGQYKIPVKVGYNEVTFVEVEEQRGYPLEVRASYDLDTNSLNDILNRNDNKYEEDSLIKVIAFLFPPSVLKVDNISAQNPETGVNSQYLNKYEEFKLSFTSKTYIGSLDGKEISYYPKSVVIDGKTYNLDKDGDTYTTKETLSGYNKAGKQTITIDSVQLSNNEVVEEDIVATLEVLKDKLSVENFALNTESKKAIVTYDLTDSDDSFVSGLITITDKENNTTTTMEVNSKQNSYELNLDPYKIYSVALEMTYDLDENKQDAEHQDKETYGPIEIELVPEYNLKIKDAKITNVNNEGHKATIEFTSTNNSHSKIKSVKIGDKEYVVTKLEPLEENRYAFEYPYGESIEGKRTEITISSVVLENDVTVTPTENESVIIFKNKPEITKIDAKVENVINIHATFEVKDEDATLTKLYAVLKDESGNELQSKDLSSINDREVTFEGVNAGKYKIEIFADYDLVDGKEYKKELLKESELIEAKAVANIKTNSISNKFPTKGDTITLDLNITSNTGLPVTSVMINGTEYEVTRYSEGNYKISYTVPTSPTGLHGITITRVNFETGIYAELEEGYKEQVDILKSAPTITNFTVTDDLEHKTVIFTFKINDPDGAFVSGKASVGEDIREITTADATKDTISFIYNTELDELKTFKIEINYNLDSDSSDIHNSDVLLFEQQFSLVSKYDLTVDNVETYKNGENTKTKYFAKNEQIQLRFNSTNKTIFEPTKIKLKNGNWYDVTAVKKSDGTTNYYYTLLKGKDTPGLEEIEILEIMLSNGKIITKDEFAKKPSNVEIDILKDIPEITDVNTTNNESEFTISFNVIDKDDALLDSYVKIVSKENNEEILNKKISKGKNTFTVTLKTDVGYTLTIERNYNLDSQAEDDQNINKEIIVTKDLEISGPKFKLRNLTIPKRIPNGSTALMTFENELMSAKDVTQIIIDGKTYDVEKDAKGVYSLTLTPDHVGVNTVFLDSVLMGEKAFKVSRYVSYIHESVEPTAYDVTEIKENLEENVAEVSYKLKDPNTAIKTLTAIMKNSAGAVAATKVLENPTDTSFDMPLIKTFRYTIELKAEYDIGDGKTFDTKTLFEQVHETEGHVTLQTETINKEFVNKGEDVVLQYKITTNVDQEVKKIFIDDISYNVEKAKDEKGQIIEDTYNVTVKAPKESGIFKQYVTRMQIGSNTYEVQDKNPVKIKVLKDKPTLTHFIIDEGKDTLSFNLNDKDGALSAKPIFTITNAAGNKTINNLKEADSSYTFKLKDLGVNKIGEEYHTIVNVSYDLKPKDAEEINGMTKALKLVANENLEETLEPEIETEGTEDIFERSIKLNGITDYNFKFVNFKPGTECSVSIPVDVSFDCSTSYDYPVTKVIVDGEEYPVVKEESRDSDHRYSFKYKAKSFDQGSFRYEKVILENGAAFEIPDKPENYTWLWIVLETPTIEVTEFEENISSKTMTFRYKVNDSDKALADVEDPIFILRDSNGKEITRKDISINNTSVEFDIPNPPSSSYKVEIRAPRVLRAQDLYEKYVELGTGEFASSVNTSILDAKFEKIYPKKGETITIDYTISSTKVILVDPEDHANLSKAVNISSLVINGTEYTAESLGNSVYRIYYTAKNTPGLEEIKVSQINFSNNTTEIFDRTDKIEVIKALPKINNYRTENDIAKGTVKFIFDLEDPDSVLTSGSIRATVGEQSQDLQIGHNEKKFSVEKDELLQFNIKGTFDLDDDSFNSETNEDENRYEDESIFTRPFMLTGSYNVEFNNIKTYNSKSEQTKYFEKNEDIKATFEFSAKSNLKLEQIKISEETYIPQQDEENENLYSITLKGTDKAGPVEVAIDSVILNSGNEVNLTEKSISYEVLKDIVKVENFEYAITEEDADDIKIKFNITDNDKSNKSLKLSIKDEYGKTLDVNNATLGLGENTVIFEKTNAAKYFVSIYSDYDRDEDQTNGKNDFKDVRVYYEVVTINTRYIEMKDIVDIQLYKFSDTGSVERVYSLTEKNLEVLDNCIVKVTMRDISPFFAEIKSYEVTNGKLKLIIDYGDAMIYNGSELKNLEVTLDILSSDQSYEYKGSFKALAEEIKANPKANITLDKDYDLGDYPGNLDDTDAIIDNFEGTLNGNGHVISNLHKPLFKNITNGKVQNIQFKGVSFTKTNQRAVVVQNASATEITNIHIDGVTFVNNDCGNQNSAFAYNLQNGSIVQNSSAININFTPSYLGQVNAGGVSNMSNSTIKNCYVQGSITSGWHFNGGLVGRADAKSQILNNIVNMSVTPYFSLTSSDSSGNGGIVSNANGATLKNNLSLMDSTANISTIYNPKDGVGISADSENNYQLEDTASTKQEHKGIKSVLKADINDKLFEDLQFNKNIWNIDNTSFENLPTLKGNTVAYLDGDVKPEYSETYIPDYNRIYHLKEYDKEREIIYHNMYKLMPFYDAKEILTDGNKIAKTHTLNKKFIKYVLAYNSEGKLVSSLNTKNYNSLRKISIVFEDGEELEYAIDFDDYYGNVVSYIVSELNIGYNYNRFVIHEDSEIVKKLVEEVSKYDFTKNLDPLTTGEDSRLYKEYFDNVTKNHITEFVENVLANSEYVPTFKNDVLDNLIVQNLVDTGKLKEMLFAYNYFKYWYNLDMDGINVADSIMFHGDEMFDKSMTLSNLSETLIKGTNSLTNVTGNFYRNNIAKYTKLSNLGEFLNYYVTNLTKFKSGNDWFKANWHGGIYIDISIDKPNVYYTIWDHLRRSSNIQNSFLPLFTVPENSMYVITSPTQTFYGSLRIYIQNPNDPEQLKKFKDNNLAQFTRQVRNFYTFAYNYAGADYLNPFVDVQYDMRTTLTDKGTKYNNPKTTTENYHKYFAEAINKWPASNGSGAYANGAEVYWNVIKLISGFNVSTHETLHNQDSKVFLQGNGRRGKDGNSEDYTAGNLQQYYKDGWVSPNIMEEELTEKSVGNPITQNYKLERVDTDQKLTDFYNKYFKVNDMLDYIEAQAFLTLDNEQKANLASQVSYPRLANMSAKEQEKGDSHVQYDPLTVDKVNKMTLKSVEDLWDNRIMLRPGVVETQNASPGAATDSLYNIRWYQPHADDDRPDGANFKWLAWEMAGHKGYFDGYMAYYSQLYIGKKTNNAGQKTTDLIALKYITGKNSFREYKLDRYKDAQSHWDDKDTYINVTEIYNAYLEALKQDAKDPKRKLTNSTNVKRKYFVEIKKATNDFEIDPFTKKATSSSIATKELNVKVEEKKSKTTEKDTNTTNSGNTTNITNTTNTSNSSNTTNSVNTTNTINSNNVANTVNTTNTTNLGNTNNSSNLANTTNTTNSSNTLAKPNDRKEENVAVNNTSTTK